MNRTNSLSYPGPSVGQHSLFCRFSLTCAPLSQALRSAKAYTPHRLHLPRRESVCCSVPWDQDLHTSSYIVHAALWPAQPSFSQTKGLRKECRRTRETAGDAQPPLQHELRAWLKPVSEPSILAALMGSCFNSAFNRGAHGQQIIIAACGRIPYHALGNLSDCCQPSVFSQLKAPA